jgi:hypothetical protein
VFAGRSIVKKPSALVETGVVDVDGWPDAVSE